jgi:hypothetical protein
VAVKTTTVEAAVEPATAMESATVMEPATAVESTTALEPATAVERATAVEPATAMATATVHLRVGSSDTAENRECRDRCDCKFLHSRLSHVRNSFTPPEK